MERNEKLSILINDLATQPPHIADFGRRQLITNAARFGLAATAMAALTRTLAFNPTFAAEESTLPEITNVPDHLKGTGEVRVCSWGGALQEAQRKAYFKPFEQLCGIRVIESSGPDVVKVKAMVDTGNVEYDIGEFDRADVINLQKKGNYWEPIDYSLVDTRTSAHRSAINMRSTCSPMRKSWPSAQTPSKTPNPAVGATCGT